jgi:hypothetical protein
MAVGTFNPNRGTDVNIENVEVFFTYSPNRETAGTEVTRLTATDVLEPLLLPPDEQNGGEDNLLEGMFNLTLPATTFNQIGIYTIFIRPRQVRLTITDCGVLSALPTVKGLVIDSTALPTQLTANNALQGFRIEYINDDGTKLRNVVRYVVTSNKVVPVTENVGNTSQSAVRYRFDDSGNLIFLQLTPSSASSVKPNATPFIGNPNQTILLNETSFDPVAVEVELVENTIDDVIDYVGGEQVKDVNNGIFTVYDRDRNIKQQFNLFEIDDEIANDNSLFEVKERRTDIDETQDINDIIDSIPE